MDKMKVSQKIAELRARNGLTASSPRLLDHLHAG